MRDTRLHCAVIRGEIDNTRIGRVTVKFWLMGKTSPLIVDLEGDCLRDLAGQHITFEDNSLETIIPIKDNLETIQTGVVGEITASQRMYLQKPDSLGEYGAPTLVNVLRVEFFTSQRRVLFESYDFNSNLIDSSWQMSEDAHFAQKASNLDQLTKHFSSAQVFSVQPNFQELANLYDELNQRLSNEMDFEQTEAALLGWSGIMDALAEDREEMGSDLSHLSTDEILTEFYDESPSGITWQSDQEVHPLIEAIQELIEDLELIAESRLIPSGSRYQTLLSVLDEIEEGLSSLLNPKVQCTLPEQTSIIGCREYLGKMMIAFQYLSDLFSISETIEGRRELLFIRDSMLELREGISALRFEIKKL